MPPVVQKRNSRAQRALYDQARAAARLPATKANGCVPAGSGRPLGPPSPRVTPRLLGHHVEVVFEFARLPRSPACRPFGLTVAVLSGRKSSSTFRNWVERYRIRGARGRVALNLPFYGSPPYHVIVEPQTMAGRIGRQIEKPLRCQETGDMVRGCLDGYSPPLHSSPMPKPVLPIRDLDRRMLEASFAQVLADERTPPVVRAIPLTSRCASLAACEVTYADPAFPESRYRVRYAIAGQQVPGCWIGLQGKRLDPMPYEDAGRGRLLLAGCASWLR